MQPYDSCMRRIEDTESYQFYIRSNLYNEIDIATTDMENSNKEKEKIIKTCLEEVAQHHIYQCLSSLFYAAIGLTMILNIPLSLILASN